MSLLNNRLWRIVFKQGLSSNLGTLASLLYQGEPVYTTDTEQIWIGDVNGTPQPLYGSGVVVTLEQCCTLLANQNATSGTGAQPWFPGGGPKSFLCSASTTYFFEGQLYLANGTTTHTTGLAFTGSAISGSIGYAFEIYSGGTNAIGGAGAGGVITQFSNTVLNSTSAAAGACIRVKGILRTPNAGSFTPEFQWSANPQGPGTNQVLANTFFRLWPIGSQSVVSVGNWS